MKTSIGNVSRFVDSAVKKLQSSFPPVNTYIDEAIIPKCCNNCITVLARHAEGGDVNSRVLILGSGVWVLRKKLLSTSDTQKLKSMYR